MTIAVTMSCDLWQWYHTKTLTLVLRIEDKRKEKKNKVKRNLGPNFLSLILESLHISTLDSFNYVFCSERTLQTTEILISFLFLIIVLFVLLLTFEYLKISKGYSHYLVYADTLIKITDSFDLRLSISIIQVPTWYTNNPNESNSVIDLIFLWVNSE